MYREISNSDDTIDSRDIIERLEELESDLQDAYDDYIQSLCDEYDKYVEENEPLDFGDWLDTTGRGDVVVDDKLREDYKTYVQEVNDNILKWDEWIAQRVPEFTEWLEDFNAIDINIDIEIINEYKILKALDEEGRGCSSDWRYGETLIRYDYFVEYCEELVKDIGDLPHNIPGYIVIDWDETAENLKVDYTELDFDGVTYYIRCS